MILDHAGLTIVVMVLLFLLASFIARSLSGNGRDPKTMMIKYIWWLVIFLSLYAIVLFVSKIFV